MVLLPWCRLLRRTTLLHLLLDRSAYTSVCTRGRLTVLHHDAERQQTVFVGQTLEPPWENNRTDVSCIPNGSYYAYRERFHKGGYGSVQLYDVPGRQEILFHIGNYPWNTEGCILLGMDGDERNVWQSRVAFRAFSSVIYTMHPADELMVTVRNDPRICSWTTVSAGTSLGPTTRIA